MKLISNFGACAPLNTKSNNGGEIVAQLVRTRAKSKTNKVTTINQACARTIKNQPKYERPRERLVALGPSNLSDTELLAIILGQGVAGCSVLQLAEQALPLIQTEQPQQPAARFRQLPGIGPIQALKLIALQELRRRAREPKPHLALTNPELVAREARALFHQSREQIIALYCNARHELLEHRLLALGKLNSVLIEPRDIFSPAFSLPAAGLFLIHNHPSGNTEPSPEDISFTQQVAQLAKILGFKLLDHLIVGKKSWSSLLQLGYLHID